MGDPHPSLPVLIVVVHLRDKYEVPGPSGLAKIPPLATDTFLTTNTFHAKHYIYDDDSDRASRLHMHV
jgi:hypothetical protein